MYERRHSRRTHNWAAWMTCAAWLTCASRPTGIPRRARSSAKSSSTQVRTHSKNARSFKAILLRFLRCAVAYTQDTKHKAHRVCVHLLQLRAVCRPDQLGEDVLGSAEFSPRRVGHLLRPVEAARLGGVPQGERCGTPLALCWCCFVSSYGVLNALLVTRLQ